MRRSVGVQSAEARLVLESRRRTRGANRSQSPSTRVAQTDVDAGDRVLRHVRDEAGACNSKDFRQTPPSKRLLITHTSCKGHVKAPLLEPSRASTDHDRVQSEATKRATCRPGLAVVEHLAAGKRSAGDGKKQQQQRTAAELGTCLDRTDNEKDSVCHRSAMVPATGQGPSPFGSEEYLKNRRRRAAQGVEVVRQCAAGLDKMSSFISNEAARRAQSLVRRLAAEKQNMAARKGEQLPAASVNHWTGDRKGKREPCAAAGSRSEVQPVRRPWRAGAASNAWAESREVMDDPRRLENAAQGGGLNGGTSDVVKDHARATVDRIVRRACLNLVNRPWRLAGVRLSIDRKHHPAGHARQRMRRARISKDGPAATLVKLQAAHEHVASTACEFRVGERPGGGPRHRRLVRPRTSPDSSRDLGSTRPSPPPFPQRRHVASASWSRVAEDGQRHATHTTYGNSRHDLLHNNFEARHPEELMSESGQGWNLQVENVKVTDRSDVVAAEGRPSSSSRGRSRLTRPTTKVIWRGAHTRNLAGGRSANRQPPKKPRWDSRFWVRDRQVSAVTSPTCGNGNPSSRVALGQDAGRRGYSPAVGEDDIASDHSTASSEGYSTSTFVSETVASSGLASDGASLGDETWIGSGSTCDDASKESAAPLGLRREVASERAAHVALEEADDEDVWFPVDATALCEMRPAVRHRSIPRLVEDARIFADTLTRLAQGQV